MVGQDRLFPLPVAAFSLTAYGAADGWTLIVRASDDGGALASSEAVRYERLVEEELRSVVGAVLEGWALERDSSF